MLLPILLEDARVEDRTVFDDIQSKALATRPSRPSLKNNGILGQRAFSDRCIRGLFKRNYHSLNQRRSVAIKQFRGKFVLLFLFPFRQQIGFDIFHQFCLVLGLYLSLVFCTLVCFQDLLFKLKKSEHKCPIELIVGKSGANFSANFLYFL